MSDQSNVISSNQKVILNANLHKTNTVPFDDFAKIAISTLEEINEMILPLCGPTAIHNLMIYEHMSSDFVSNVFSNDGIHNLKSIEHLSPIQTYITGYIIYIAERVDRAAGDGTSTAIYLASNFIIVALKRMVETRKKFAHLPTIERCKKVNEATHATKDQFINIIDKLMGDIDLCTIDLHDIDIPEETRRKLIYRLAYTTSKGNVKLSQFAVDLFINLPEMLYEQTNYKRAQIETDDDFIIEYPEHDAIVSVNPDPTTKYNKELYTELHHDSCDLIICPHYMEDIEPLLAYIKSRPARPLIVLHNGANDPDMVRLQNEVNNDYVTLCNYIIYHPTFLNNPIEPLSILAMASIDVTEWKTSKDYEDSVITDVKCVIKDKLLHIYNLFTPIGDSPIHPNYINKDNDNYNKLVSELETKLSGFKVSHQQKNITRDITEFTRIYRSLICSKMPVLTVGGSTIEHLANINVVDDVNGAVSVAMKNGVIIDLVPKILDSLKHIVCITDDVNYGILTKFKAKPINMINEFESIVADFAKLNYTYPVEELNCNKFSHYNKSYVKRNVTNECNPGNINFDDITVVQSYRAIRETLVRLLETVPKLMIADQVIVPNGVMDKSKDE